MPRLLDELHQDHINVDKLLGILAGEFDRYSAMGAADFDIALDVVRYLTDYSDRYHHPREDLMYDRLLLRLPQVGSDIKQVIAQHDELASAGRNLKEHLAAVESDALVTRDSLQQVGEAYIAQLRAHMFSEEDVFFPIAARHLKDTDWEEIESELRVSPDPVFGDRPDAEQPNRFAALVEYVEREFPALR